MRWFAGLALATLVVPLAGGAAASKAQTVSPPLIYHRVPPREHRRPGYINRLEWKVREAARTGLISGEQSQVLLARLGRVHPLAFRDEVGASSTAERATIDQTVLFVENAISRDAQRRHAAGYPSRSASSLGSMD